jgi:DNA (cytosine-5)-methyltransferase 3A
MDVLSLFDGMSCGRIALERAGIPVTSYHACEIKKSAIIVSNSHYPDIIRHGNVVDFSPKFTPDILLAGTPCQDFSIARVSMGKKTITGLDGDKSKLFYEALRIKRERAPKYFLFENVKMKKESKDQLDDYLGVEGIEINSSNFSFQNRKRYYWTNIPVARIEDSETDFQDYIHIDDANECRVNRTPSRIRMWNNGEGRTHSGACVNITKARKIGCLTKKQDRCPNSGLIEHEDFCRYLCRTEMELAQTVPVGYTKSVSYNQAQDLLGDGWTVDVIAHIFGGLK